MVVDVVIRGTGKTLPGSGWPRGSNYEVEGCECSASCSHTIPSARSGLLGSHPPSEGTVADKEMGFLMQPIKRFTVLEEVNDSDVPPSRWRRYITSSAPLRRASCNTRKPQS